MSLINQLIQKVNDLTTVVNSIIANAKDMASLPDATVPVSGTDKIRITQGGIDRKVDVSEVGGSGDAVARMRWMNEWVNATYETNDVVVDGAYTMVANKTTSERPAPQLIGDATWMYDGTIATEQNSAKLIITGADYTLVNALSISKYRLDVILGNHYALYLVVDPDLTNVKSERIDFVATETGWKEVVIPSEIIPAGTNFRVLLATNEPDPTPVSWTGDWDYDTPNNDGTPTAGEILHSNNDSSLFNIHKTDNNGGDRGAELLALSVGDIIDGAGTRWTIGSINDNGTYITFGVSPTLQGTPDGVSTFSFETVSATPITTGLDTDYFLGNANIRGLFAIDGDLDDVVENDNGYGVDIELQQVTVSDDWDFLAISGGAGGSSSSGGGDIEIVDNLTTQDSTKALSANQGYVLDQSKSNVGHTHSGTLGDILIKTADYSTLNNDAESDATLVFKAPATSILLDSTAGVSVGFRQEVVNNTGGVLTIGLIGTDTTIGELPASIPDGQMAYYTLVEATIWAVAYGEEVAPHSLTDHIDVNSASPSPNDRLAWDNVTSMWIPKASLSALGFVEFSYKMDLPAEATPISGDVSRDTDNPSTATTLYFNKLDSAGNDKSLFFQEMKSGDWINLHDDADVVNEESYDIIGAGVLNGNIWEIPVALYEVGGVVLGNNDDLQVFWRIQTEEVLQVAIVLHDDGNGNGYVPANRDFTNFAAVGFNALDTSVTDGTYGIDRGASGENAIAFGMNVKASAWGSLAMGHNLNSLGVLSFVHGYKNEASGYAPFVVGFDNISTQDYSFTGGVSNENNANRGFMWGQALKASLGTGAFIVGQSNVDPVSDNIAFLVGVGTYTQEGDNTLTRLVPKDGFTIFKDGTTRIGNILFVSGTAMYLGDPINASSDINFSYTNAGAGGQIHFSDNIFYIKQDGLTLLQSVGAGLVSTINTIAVIDAGDDKILTTKEWVLANGINNPMTADLQGNGLKIFNCQEVHSNNFVTEISTTPPATSTSNGVEGQIIYTADYIYVCVSDNVWRRTQLTTW